MKPILATGLACLALAACATSEPPAPPPRPLVTYTFPQPPIAVAACLNRYLSRVAVAEEELGLRVTVQNIPGASVLLYTSVDGTRAEVYQSLPTQAGVFQVGLDQCEQHLPKPRSGPGF